MQSSSALIDQTNKNDPLNQDETHTENEQQGQGDEAEEEEEEDEEPGYTIKLQNVVATVTLGVPLDLVSTFFVYIYL